MIKDTSAPLADGGDQPRDEKGRFRSEQNGSGGGALAGAVAGGAIGSSYGPGGPVAGAIIGAFLGDTLEKESQD